MKVVYRVDDDVYKGTQNMEQITQIVNELHKVGVQLFSK